MALDFGRGVKDWCTSQHLLLIAVRSFFCVLGMMGNCEDSLGTCLLGKEPCLGCIHCLPRPQLGKPSLSSLEMDLVSIAVCLGPVSDSAWGRHLEQSWRMGK
jgi:hypothetical protein